MYQVAFMRISWDLYWVQETRQPACFKKENRNKIIYNKVTLFLLSLRCSPLELCS